MTVDVSKERTRNYLQQIKGAVVYKALGMLASFLAMPLMIRYLGQEQFGVWSTLLTVMSWIVFFDLGVGNGLRNKVAEALARNDKAEAANYIGSAYGLIGVIALGLWAVVTGVSFFVPWQVVFNTQAIAESSLRTTVQTAVFFVVFNFWLGLINALLGAMQRTSLVAMGQMVSNVIALLGVFVLAEATSASVTFLTLVYGASLVIANMGLSWWFYQANAELRPRLRMDRQHVSPLLSVGLQFFFIQVAVLVIFATDKILITQLLGPAYVAQYDVVFKLFSLISFAHALISTPLWSAYTDAYQRGDMDWIKRMFDKQLRIFGLVIFAAGVLGFAIKPVVYFWIGRDMTVSPSLILALGVFVLISTWNNIFAVFVNGIGIIKLQLYAAIVAMIVNIPLAVLFVKVFKFGLSGVVWATVASLLLAAVVLPVQVSQIIRTRTRELLP